MGAHNELFEIQHTEASFARAKKMRREVGTQWVELIVFDGVHEFLTDS